MKEKRLSGADEKMREVLGHVAAESLHACDPSQTYGEDIAAILGVLERRLLPILLAGQAMRDEYLRLAPATTILTWDRALAAAQGQPGDGK